MNKFFIMTVCFISIVTLTAKEDLSHLPGVKYVYLGFDNSVVPGSQFKDKDNKYLTDRRVGVKESAQSQWVGGTEKAMKVRFLFPVSVKPNKVRVGWSWTHGQPKQWIDEITVISDKGQQIGKVELNGVKKDHNVWIDVPVTANNTMRHCTIQIRQKANPGHYFFGIGEIIIEGSDKDGARIKNYSKSNAGIILKHKYPVNHFESGETIELPVSIKLPQMSKGQLEWCVKGHDGRIADKGTAKLQITENNAKGTVRLDPLPNGYYDLICSADMEDTETGDISHYTGKTSFIVLPTVQRTAAEAHKMNPRFGVQSSIMTEELHLIFSKLGISYRRNLLYFAPMAGKDPKNISWTWLDDKIKKINNNRENYFFEIKTTPHWLRAANDKSNDWFLRMPTDLKKYGEFISEQITHVPDNYQIFELWNEPWGHYTGQEFARLTAVMRDAIRKVKPNAKIGPNLGPMTQLSNYLDSNGMEGMDYLSVHPYSPDFRSSPESVGLYDTMLAYRKILKEKTGRDIPLIVSEIGWPTTRVGKTNNSELRQAQYIARAAVILTALDVKLIIPYCAWQTEERDHDMECWFGMVRKNLTPKPSLASYATVARKLEGVNCVGYLPLSQDIYAPIFRKRDNSLIAAIWADGKQVPFFLSTGVEQITVTNMVGKEEVVQTPFGRCSMTATDSVIYLEGLSEKLLELCQKDAPKAKVKKKPVRNVPYLAAGGSWDKIPGYDVTAGNDASMRFQLAHDGSALWIKAVVKDPNPGIKRFNPLDSWRGDCLELFISGAPDKIIPGFTKENDFQILATPFGPNGKQVMICCDDNHRGKELPGSSAQWKVGAKGYEALIRIPFSAIGAPQNAAEIAFDITLDDICKNHGRAMGISNNREDNNINAALWTILKLQPKGK